ncbi:(Fe-S)-binding protein [Paenibacillus sp. GCM10027626]|uniref:(Fe-S)-binding protein n=1 Tax=Paenibacillus sp. GCM10027626 TaxID=3273411 RepID=UPI00362CBEEC
MAEQRTKETDMSLSLVKSLQNKLDYDQLTNCMRCGFCLPACPTFRETGVEAESPRGRIALMKAAVDGLMEPDHKFEEQMDHCLGCRACEPACPAGVKYGQLIEQARDAVEDHTVRHRWWVKGARKIAFDGLFPHPRRMRLLGGALKLYQKSGLQTIARGTGIMNLFPPHLKLMEKIMPDTAGTGVVKEIGMRHPAKGEKLGTVGMFRGCIMDIMFTKTNINTVKLLTEAGFEVVIPDEQTCCGALHSHSGEGDGAKELARRNIRAFRDAGVDWIATNSGGCGALLVEYDHLLHDDAEWSEDAAWFAKQTIDVSRLVVEHGRVPQFAASKAGTRITYQDSCHLRNVMKSSDAPRKLMKSVAGVQFVEMVDSDRCCGSAGIYNLTQPEMSGGILDKKMECAKDTSAQVMITSNPGCLLQMKAGISKSGMDKEMEAVHIVDFLYENMAAGSSPESK